MRDEDSPTVNDFASASADEDRPAFHLAVGRRFAEQRRYSDAELSFARAVALDPDSAAAQNNLGWVREAQGDEEAALRCYERALELRPALSVAQVNLATLLSKMGRDADAERHWLALAMTSPGNRAILGKVIDAALRAGHLAAASERSEEYARLFHGGQAPGTPASPGSGLVHLTIPRLRHDIEQFSYLRAQGVMPDEMTEFIQRYARVLAVATSQHDTGDRWEMSQSERSEIGSIYNRFVHFRPAQRVGQALSPAWDRTAVEQAYLHHPFGLAVVDDFLSEDALLALRLFCLRSTFWFSNRHAYGRLGATFRRGFNCPLVIQVGQELAAALPRVIGDKHRLLQMWAYKYDSIQPATSAHADFAAVNVNFWLTPDEANLDPASGGMIIYDAEAPMSWDFDSYNKQGGKITRFLREQSAQSITVPYRANRAVIFNSDMFHATQPLRFRDRYEDRRINVTFLFGSRDRDQRPATG
jgi:tetratricopeptide (TPR) repeat protein